jgi:nucleoside 2-deoxyribosyltransferase
MTHYSIISRFRNKTQCKLLISELKKRGKTCYNFFEIPSDQNNPNAHPEEQMKNFESVKNFYNDQHFNNIFKKDLDGLKNAEKIILLLPAGTSAHIEAGIAYGLGKPLILIGKPEKPESLYLIFKKRYETIDEFLKTI